ncbi:TetR/AcrR family transcriptional regulator [Microtetraspora malaysiensis]|uniref:TetR/AcrR family transcriptional regulator n=2 Tax=Microtetraspora malaysiensis TaxID=161358 RepID=UPI003D901DDB
MKVEDDIRLCNTLRVVYFEGVNKAPDPTKRSEAARQAVLEAALALCKEDGYPRLTIEGIAARSGVSKKTIYRWWPSKGAVLLEAVIEEAADTAGHPDTGNLVEDVIAQLKAVIALLTPHQTSALTGIIAEALRDDDLAANLREQLIMPNIGLFDERMRSAQRRGEIPEGADLKLLNDLLHGTLYHRLVFHLGMPDDDELRERIEVVLVGLNARAH